MKVIQLLDMLSAVLTELDALAEDNPGTKLDVTEGEIWTHGASFTRSDTGEWRFVFTDEGSMYKSHGYSDDHVDELVQNYTAGAEVRDWHILQWNPSRPDEPTEGTRVGNPEFLMESRPWNWRPNLTEQAWIDPAEGVEDALVEPGPRWLHVAGWNREKVLDVFMALREQWNRENGETA